MVSDSSSKEFRALKERIRKQDDKLRMLSRTVEQLSIAIQLRAEHAPYGIRPLHLVDLDDRRPS